MKKLIASMLLAAGVMAASPFSFIKHPFHHGKKAPKPAKKAKK